jgi:type I restriction enzyme R subunit
LIPLYEAFLKNAEELAKKLARSEPEAGVPPVLYGNREATALFNNLDSIPAGEFKVPEDPGEKAQLALEIDMAVREHAPAGFKGDQAKEAQVLNVLFPLLNRDRNVTLALFEIIKNQPGYA